MIRSATASLIAFLLLASCGGDDDTDLDPTLAGARQRWAAADLRNYQFTYSTYCFCPFPARKVVVTVSDGVAVSAFEKETGRPLTASELLSVRTVNSIFSTIEDAYAKHADVIKFTTDPVLGYPTSVSIDYKISWADDEIAFEVFELVPVAKTSIAEAMAGPPGSSRQ